MTLRGQFSMARDIVRNIQLGLPGRASDSAWLRAVVTTLSSVKNFGLRLERAEALQ